MSTQKNEHNPDNLTPEQVGEGWRLLGPDEIQQPGDEWWSEEHHGWQDNPKEDSGLRVTCDDTGNYLTYRRRITPPTDTTGSGREGETPVPVPCSTTSIWPKTDEVFVENVKWNLNRPEAKDMGAVLEHMLNRPKTMREWAMELEEANAELLALVEALRRDGELLDHLDSSLNQLAIFGNFVMGGEKQSARAAIRRHMEHCKRAAIDSAQRQEGE